MKTEITILRELDDPNLIKLDSVYETTTSYYLIFELFSGGNLKDYVKQSGPLSESEACYITRKILEGLRYLHKNNIMHRDIKPENILFRTEKIFQPHQIAIADFGLATHNDVAEYLYGRCGTPGYVAPEVYNFRNPGDHYSLKCDLYSVGITFFFMVTGKLPYEEEYSLQYENKEMRFDPCRLKKLSNEGFYIYMCLFEYCYLISFFKRVVKGFLYFFLYYFLIICIITYLDNLFILSPKFCLPTHLLPGTQI